MATSNITTETGDLLVQETVAGITGASSLNDTHVEEIFREDFSTDPASRWLIGAGWQWDSGNDNMEPI